MHATGGGVPATRAEFAIGSLRRCALFAGVDEPTLARCIDTLGSRRYRRNETIFHQGDPGESLYILESGSVKIVLPSPGSADDAIIATLTRGDFFGELALLDGAPHSATAVATEPSEALLLGRTRFQDLVEADPALRRALFAGLAAELRRLTGHVEELLFLDLPGRLASRIAHLARETQPGQATEVRLDWPYTQSDLASMVGGTRQTVNRILADMTMQGLIRVERDTLVIPDLARLDRAAER